jgi:hypothetical protein
MDTDAMLYNCCLSEKNSVYLINLGMKGVFTVVALVKMYVKHPLSLIQVAIITFF